jgi:hypothetical protein
MDDLTPLQQHYIDIANAAYALGVPVGCLIALVLGAVLVRAIS